MGVFRRFGDRHLLCSSCCLISRIVWGEIIIGKFAYFFERRVLLKPIVGATDLLRRIQEGVSTISEKTILSARNYSWETSFHPWSCCDRLLRRIILIHSGLDYCVYCAFHYWSLGMRVIGKCSSNTTIKRADIERDIFIIDCWIFVLLGIVVIVVVASVSCKRVISSRLFSS